MEKVEFASGKAHIDKNISTIRKDLRAAIDRVQHMTHARMAITAFPLTFGLGISAGALAQEVAQPTWEQEAQPPAPPSAPTGRQASPASIARTFAPTGLLAEHNSAENFAALQARIGTLRSHQLAADSTGVTSGYRDKIQGIAIPLKAIIPLDPSSQTLYVKLGAAQGWTLAESGNLTEVDSKVSSGLAQILYRPRQDILIGLGLTASRTNLDFEHNGGSGQSDSTGLQADYMQKISNNFGITARAIYDWGETDTAIPLGTSGRTLESNQDSTRLYLEATMIGNFKSAETGWLGNAFVLRPTATLLYQNTDFNDAQTNLGSVRPGKTEKFGMLRSTLRIEIDEKRPFHIAPYAVAGIEQEFVNTVSQVDHDATAFYMRTGIAMNVGGKGHFDLYYARHEGLDGTYSAGQITALLSMSF